MFHVRQKIGYYTLIRKLGEGSFGEVWLAENCDQSPSERVALKLPRKDQIDLQAVKDEIFNWILSGKHKNILPIIECETFGNQVAIVSEFAPDGSLKDLLNKRGSLSVADAVEITIGILDGLAHLHNRKIIHRDLKPDNILFQGKIPRLTDFGISRAMPVDSYSQTISGTLWYMAPEAFDGKRNEQTDIWSVGVTLYQLLTGNVPFPQKERVELMGAIVMREPEPLPDSIPLILQKIVKKSMAKDQSKRYQNADNMRKELNNFWVEHSRSFSSLPTQPEVTNPTPIENSPLDVDVQPDSIKKVQFRHSVLSSLFSNLKGNLIYLAPFAIIVTFAVLIATDNLKPIGGTNENNSNISSNTAEGVIKVAGAVGKSYLPKDTEMSFAYIPAGTFDMGSNMMEDEKPVHKVEISEGFWMGQTEVTQKQWKSLMGELPECQTDRLSNDYSSKVFERYKEDFLGDNKPAICVSWNDVRNFISRLNALNDGYEYRLPTEAEWEYAARSETVGDYAGSLEKMAWFKDNSSERTHNVASKQANGWKLYDMHGNVWEWCQDVFESYKYGVSKSGSTSSRVIRGGSWDLRSEYLRSANRNFFSQSIRNSSVGFRMIKQDYRPNL